MNKNIIISASALFLFASCNYNEVNFPELDDLSKPSNILNLDITLTTADYSSMGSDAKKNLYFTSVDSVDKYVPVWLGKTYYTASPTSVIRVTYNFKEGSSELLQKYQSINYLSLDTKEQYAPVYEGEDALPYMTAANLDDMYKILNAEYPSADKGALAWVDYDFSEAAMSEPAFTYDFEALDVNTSGVDEIDTDWFLQVDGSKKWTINSFNGNKFLQYTAYKATGACTAWAVTPAITIEDANKALSFNMSVGHRNADCLSVFVSTDFDGNDVEAANWDDITSDFVFPEPASGYSEWVSVGKSALAKYAGKQIRVAFKYDGDGTDNRTTTYQIDDILVDDISNNVTVTPQFGLYAFDGSTWDLFKNSSEVYAPTWSDYVAMGAPGKNLTFSSSVDPANYLPSYLKSNAAYAQNNDSAIVIYKYTNSSKVVSIEANEYKYSTEENNWIIDNNIVEKARQFAFDGKTWMFDPSISLALVKGDKVTSAFYQAMTDWVKENKGAEYVTSYGNNDYYYGGSAYQNNFDFRAAKWREQNAAAYEDLTDDQLSALMFDRLPEAFLPGLEATYPNATTVDGVHVYYTITFSIYNITGTTQWTIKYEVTGKSEFTYVEDSLQEIA